jgi:hypothetical protein
MSIHRSVAAAFAALTLLVAQAVPASAVVYTFVGSWQVYNPAAPEWFGSPPNGPLAYTGQEAAALLFGGAPANYVISTVDSTVANINHKAWYDVIGFGGSQFAENYSSKYLGLYYGPTSGYNTDPAMQASNAASAFVRDNFVDGTNYAFLASGVPEPATWAMMLIGFGGLAFATSRRRRIAVAA